MWLTYWKRSCTKACLLQRTRASFALCSSKIVSANFVREEVWNGGECIHVKPEKDTSISLAKSLACLSEDDESPCLKKRKSKSLMQIKRSLELRIKKRVKAQYLDGKFHHLLEKVIADAETLQDSYEILSVNSNVDQASKHKDICFYTMAERLKNMDFDIKSNTFIFSAKGPRREHLVLPKLELMIIQEAIKTVLEIVYRPHFSKISHGCRSGRGHHSAIGYILREAKKDSWWFTLPMNKEIDTDIFSKMILLLKERIDDELFLSFIQGMFEAGALNLFFGGFPKGYGLPQEGILSPILMNIYLDMFDREFFRVSMKYEGFSPDQVAVTNNSSSNLRNWIRRQMKDGKCGDEVGGNVRLRACRHMDEIFISVSGSGDVARRVKDELKNYLQNSLFVDVEDKIDTFEVKDNPNSVQFLGTTVRIAEKETNAVRAVHKLKEKVKLFASQKQEIWDAGTVRIGKKWLAYGLKRIKESEIKNLGLSTPMLDYIAKYRKDGMKTDHWFKSLLKIWLQDLNANKVANEEVILAKYIAEPALPSELRDSFYKFQQKAEEYVRSETNATSALLPNFESCSEEATAVTKVEAPVTFMMRNLHRYGLINIEGYPRPVSTLLLQEDSLIVAWFSGLVRRWHKWYSECDNFRDVKLMMVECVRKSCIRTLAAKHRIHETLIEKKFESELSDIPATEDLEIEMISERPEDEALAYGILYSGLCMLSLSNVKVPRSKTTCFVIGCSVASPSMYKLVVKERQRYPGWKTGFSTSIHPSLNGRRIALCSQHIKDLYLGNISLQSIDFGSLMY